MKEGKRKLAAIMFTDIVGYTALMAKDERKALRILKKNRDLHKSLIEKFNGEYLKEMGDGTLCCFDSAVDAVNCSLEIQRTLKDEPELTLRIGIHIGDVLFSGGDVFGDGVNVASRIEPLAEPGGITVSEKVYDDIRNKPYIEAVLLGEKEFKNVDHPIKVYALTGGILPSTTVGKTAAADIRAEIKAGTTISHYKIIEKLGEGGMGVVYMAEDTKLKRTVALKFLRPEVLGSEEQKTRFINEAQTAAALDHPSICTVHEIDEVKGHTFIAMSFIEGKSLRQKIESGPLKVKDALDIAIQVAEGLKEAHDKGIFHRDIKPENILMTKSGQSKIVDFGIAKYAGGKKLTKEGTTVGTVSYMSPEQARGEPVDQRTDIFSLGIVLYEKLTGQLPFRGSNEQTVIYSILNREPESVKDLRPELSENFTYVLNRALEKDPEERYQSASDMLIDLRRLKRDTSKIITRAKPAPAFVPLVSSKKRSFIYGAAALVVLMVIMGYLLWKGEGTPPVPKFTNTTQVTTTVSVENCPTWLPDGTRLAYHSNHGGNWDIWVTQIGGGTPVNMTADYTGDDLYPSWSPDGSEIAFWSNQDGPGYYAMSALAGSPRKVLPTVNFSLIFMPGPPQWSSDGKELACITQDSTGRFVEIVSLQLETSRRLLLPGDGGDNRFDLNWSPDGSYFAYVSCWDRVDPIAQLWVIGVADEVSFPVTDVESQYWSPQWSNDGRTLYFISNRGGSLDLWQQRLEDDGTPVDSPQQITYGLEMQYAKFSSDEKKLAFSKVREFNYIWRVPILIDRPATWSDARQLTFEQVGLGDILVTPDGKRIIYKSYRDENPYFWVIELENGDKRRLTTDPFAQHNAFLSPDGREVAIRTQRGSALSTTRHIWIAPVDGGPARQLTKDEQLVGFLKWSPDGNEIAFKSNRSGNGDIWVIPAQGGEARQITVDPANDGPPKWSPDGKEIAFRSNRSGNGDIWIIPAKDGEARQLTVNPANDQSPEWSPDGEWLLFKSNRTGNSRFWKIPAEGGNPEPLTEENINIGFWSPDGKKVYFTAERNGAFNFYEVSADGGPERQLTDLQGKTIKSPYRNYITTDWKYFYFLSVEDIGDIWVMDVVENK